MLSFFRKIRVVPTLKGLDLNNRPGGIHLDRLHTGVDNIRHDVCLSQEFSKAVRNLVLLIIARHSGTGDFLNLDCGSGLIQEKERVKKLCQDIMLNALNRAKSDDEIQIDLLMQVAVIKLVVQEIRNQYAVLQECLKNAARQYEVANRQEQALALKQRMTTVAESRDILLRNTGDEAFECLLEAQHQNVNEMRRINFGENAVIPDEFLPNPMLYIENPSDDFFIIREYEILLGHRVEDPDKYANLLAALRNILLEIHSKDMESIHFREPGPDAPESGMAEGWLMYESNIDLLVNCFQLKNQCAVVRKEGGSKEEISMLKKEIAGRKKRLDFFYSRLKKTGIISRFIAAYEMQPLYLDYCPPLVPQLIAQFFISRRMRRDLKTRIRRLKKFYGKSLTLKPLHRKHWRMRFSGIWNRKAYLIRFLKDFSRYHRDRCNFEMLKELMDRVHLATDEKIIHLSRANNRLYEFLLSHEKPDDEKPIISHVIIKADVRGSTDITHRMLTRGLNPASYFSLNFFDPITEILSDYNASKVFVEGDAIILSIFDREETPGGWYSVARACGLAVQMLNIVQKCNTKNIKYSLPIIELGIGICFRNDVPTFLFDGDHRIMISSAINLADRLSGCSKPLRKYLSQRKISFNLYVFQGISEEMRAKSADDLSLRYNVNGIELNSEGFEKLCKEIDMKPVETRVSGETVIFHTGKYPLATGGYHRLVIREAPVLRINPETMEIMTATKRKYYEVCTNTKLISHVRQRARGKTGSKGSPTLKPT